VRRRLASLVLLLALPAGGCGRDEAAPAAAPVAAPLPWHTARVTGMPAASDLALLGDELWMSCGGNERRLFVVRAGDLVEGGTVAAQVVPTEVAGDAYLSGGEEFAARGFQAKDLWGATVDFQGLAAAPPALLFVGERTHRVVHRGTIVRGADGRPSQVAFRGLFTFAGSTRPGRERSDWRDTSGGLAGLVALPRPQGSGVELYAVDRHGTDEARTRLWRMDDFGFVRSWFEARFAKGSRADVGGVAWREGRPLLVRGEGSGIVQALREGRSFDVIDPTPGTEGAPLEPPGRWRGIAAAPDGTLYLAGGGEACIVAWRREQAEASGR
jgi:hypothetical protein